MFKIFSRMSWWNFKRVVTTCILQTTQWFGLQTFTSITSRASISGEAKTPVKKKRCILHWERNISTVREVLKKTSHLGARQNGSHVDLWYNLEAEIEVICIPGGKSKPFFSNFFANTMIFVSQVASTFCQYFVVKF